jgi:hypothetical protein
MGKVRFERSSGLRRWSLELSFLRLSLRWEDQVRRLLNISPRYLTFVKCGTTMLLIVTAGQFRGLSEKVTKEDFDSLIFIFQLVNHCEREFRWVWIWWDAVVWSEETDNRAVSSAYVPTKVFSDVGRSDVYMVYKKGAISLPWGT